MSNLEAAVDRTRALGHPARLRALAMLRTGELCVCQITEVLGLAQSTVSTHLRELKRARLITERKDGRWVYFGLSSDPDARIWIDVALTSLEGDAQLESDDLLVEDLRRLPVADLCKLGYAEAKAKARQRR
ncbi:MAG: metalloregulator ArsR/SmtB family transcription factor [Thermoanaerobaculales bacterium]|jgi:DNA-binding transcriptional ArsR family regulator|nr:metalloregulator ArsR/SmtB family transcription factor [Thermoanaerobaculales bacterium]